MTRQTFMSPLMFTVMTLKVSYLLAPVIYFRLTRCATSRTRFIKKVQQTESNHELRAVYPQF